MKKTTNVSDTSGLTLSQKTVQLTLQFDASPEPLDTEPPKPRATSSLMVNQEKYASVKKVSLVFEGSLQGRPCLTSTQDALAFFKSYWSNYPASDQEKFVVACLDTKHRVQCVVVVTVGTLDASLVHPREVFKSAFIEGSSALIMSHNHPSGNTTPSREDHRRLITTQTLYQRVSLVRLRRNYISYQLMSWVFQRPE